MNLPQYFVIRGLLFSIQVYIRCDRICRSTLHPKHLLLPQGKYLRFDHVRHSLAAYAGKIQQLMQGGFLVLQQKRQRLTLPGCSAFFLPDQRLCLIRSNSQRDQFLCFIGRTPTGFPSGIHQSQSLHPLQHGSRLRLGRLQIGKCLFLLPQHIQKLLLLIRQILSIRFPPQCPDLPVLIPQSDG